MVSLVPRPHLLDQGNGSGTLRPNAWALLTQLVKTRYIHISGWDLELPNVAGTVCALLQSGIRRHFIEENHKAWVTKKALLKSLAETQILQPFLPRDQPV